MNPSFFHLYIAPNFWPLLIMAPLSLAVVGALIMALMASADSSSDIATLRKTLWTLESSYALIPAIGALGTIWQLWRSAAQRNQWEVAGRSLTPVLQQALVPLAFSVVLMVLAAVGCAIVRYRLIDLDSTPTAK